MKKYFCLFIFFLVGMQGYAQTPFYDYDFNQEKMTIQNDKIYLISTFENRDHLTCYDFHGRRLWNMPFNAKITSWRALDDIIFVFSKARNDESTYITCIDAWTGALLWQRP